MSNFLKVRLLTLIWGLLVVWGITKDFNLTSSIFLLQVIGNTIIMRVFIK